MNTRSQKSHNALGGILLGLLLTTLGAGVQAEGKAVSLGEVSGWQLFYKPNPQGDGGCRAVGAYGDDAVFFIGPYGQPVQWKILFFRPQWKGVAAEERWPISYQFAGGKRWDLTAVATEKYLIAGGLDSGFIEDLASAHGMTLLYKDQPLGQFSLKGTRKMTQALLACHRKYIGKAAASTPAPSEAEALVERLNQRVVQLINEGKYEEAEPLAKQTLAMAEADLGSEHPEVATSLNNLASLYHNQGRYNEAEPLNKRSLAIREKALGPDHPAVATSINNLAMLYKDQGRYAEAEPLYQRSLTIMEKALGSDHPNVATSVNNLADLYHSQGRYTEAEPLYKRSLAISEKALGPEHPDVAIKINNLAMLYGDQGRYAEAEPLYQRSLAIWEKALGTDHPNVATSLNNLAQIYQSQGRYAEAEPLYQRSLAIREKALGPVHPDVASSLNNLASLYYNQGRYAEAEPLNKRSLAIREKALGPDHPAVATSINNLAMLYQDQGRYAEAEPLYKRSLAISEKALGPEHPDVAIKINNLAMLYQDQGRFTEAEPLNKRSLAIREKTLGPEHPNVATSLNNLALLYDDQGRYSDAEPLFKRSLVIREKALGPEHPDVATSLNNLAGFYQSQGRYAEAEPLYQRSLAVWEKALGTDHPNVATSLNNLAGFYLDQGKIAEALPLRHRVLAIDAERLREGTAGKQGGVDNRDHALDYLPLLTRPETQPAYLGDRLLAMQLAQRSGTAVAFEQLAQRLAAGGSGALADLVRQRQDLIRQLAAADKRLLDSYSSPEGEAQRAALHGQIDALRQQEEAVSQRLQRDFPAFAEFEGTKLADLAALQLALQPNEAILAWVLGKKESYRLLVRKAGPPKIEALAVGEAALSEAVTQMHQALDLSSSGRLMDFPAARAATLYEQLFAGLTAEDLAGVEHLLLVPEGPLTRLPFAALLTASPVAETFPAQGPEYAQAPWLARRFGLSLLPSLSAITSLRNQPRTAGGQQPFLGIGDPLLDDHPTKTRGTKPGKAKQPAPVLAQFRNARGLGRVPEQLEKAGNLRQARLELLREQPSLPDTAAELQAIAKLLHSPGGLLLRDQATETQVKRQPLGNYRVLSFATHGLLAGELGSNSEPGLILTPPAQASEQGDGYLSVSEVAALKLNADWVILSACNTAGSEGAASQRGEGLTGLAKAFAYAGAKSLLVSHWAVNSTTTVELMERLFHQHKDRGLGKAKAHQQAMLEMIGSGDPLRSHPSVWAPFVVVGEGGETRDMPTDNPRMPEQSQATDGSISAMPETRPQPVEAPDNSIPPQSPLQRQAQPGRVSEWGNGIEARLLEEPCPFSELTAKGYQHLITVDIPRQRIQKEEEAWLVQGERAVTLLGCWYPKQEGNAHAYLLRKKDGKVTEKDLNLRDGSWRELPGNHSTPTTILSSASVTKASPTNITSTSTANTQEQVWVADWGHDIHAFLMHLPCEVDALVAKGYRQTLIVDIPINRLKNKDEAWHVTKNRAIAASHGERSEGW